MKGCCVEERRKCSDANIFQHVNEQKREKNVTYPSSHQSVERLLISTDVRVFLQRKKKKEEKLGGG